MANIQDYSASYGRWVWKEDGKTLEFIPNNPIYERSKQRDRRQGKGFGLTDRGRASPSGLNRSGYGTGQGRLARDDRLDGYIPLHVRQATEYSRVTLELVKSVAYDMMQQQEKPSSIMFEELYGTPEFDKFMLCLFNFFHWYLEKKMYEEKPNPMNIERSKSEMVYHAKLCEELAKAQKLLGQGYGTLVLGIGMSHYHHMHCGRQRVSNTLTDRIMYEVLYTFCTYCVWVAFKRPDFKTVKKELNRILRSQTFNPAIRIKHAEENASETEVAKPTPNKLVKADAGGTSDQPSTSKDVSGSTEAQMQEGTSSEKPEKASEKKEDAKKPSAPEPPKETKRAERIRQMTKDKKKTYEVRGKKVTPAEYRRMQEKRPPIKSIIDQRSPAVVSMLPLPKEESMWLFQRNVTHTPTPGTSTDAKDDMHSIKNLGSLDVTELQVGIIGQQMSGFNQQTLLPKGTETEEEGANNTDDNDSTTGAVPAPPPHVSSSKDSLVIPEIVTEGATEE